MVDFGNGDLITLKQVGGVIKRLIGRSYCYETIRQWTDGGRRGVRLDVLFVGGQKYTTEAAVVKFVRAYTHKRAAPEAKPVIIDKKKDDAARASIMAMLNGEE